MTQLRQAAKVVRPAVAAVKTAVVLVQMIQALAARDNSPVERSTQLRLAVREDSPPTRLILYDSGML